MRCLALLALLVSAPFPSAVAGEAEVRWKGRAHDVARLPLAFPAEARAALELWGPWAAEHGYRMDLTDDGRVLLVTDHGDGRVERELELVARAAELFDRTLPAPPRAAPETAAAAPADAPLPEDPGPLPEDPEVPVSAPRRTVAGPAPPTAWGTAVFEPDAHTATILVTRNERDFSALLDDLAERRPYLADWAADARRFPGFVLADPLAGAYAEAAAGQEEWSADNELVSRVARLLLLRRFGQQPNWVVQGWAWYTETSLLGTVYCFPWRDEFVFVTEHADWDRDLERRYEDREDALAPREFMAWKRGVYESGPARVSWGVVSFLAAHRAEAFPLYLEDLRLLRDAGNRVEQGDGTWVRDPDFVLPAEDQARLLRERAGEGVFEELVRYFQDMDGYRPKRR